ncbi:hypothetical protein [Amaricoccus macauensis]|uniref:hypothetical protein n=1 Tax=Amaricoccus macauensis TaxID=57001 RepID=UPI003C7DBE28
MRPADGSDFPQTGQSTFTLCDTSAILLHGGRTLLLIESAEQCLPASGTLSQEGNILPWHAKCWQTGGGDAARWCAIAILDALPKNGAELRDPATGWVWTFSEQPSVDVAPQPLADLVRRSGVDCRDVFNFLTRHLLEGRSDSDEARSYQEFARNFFTAAAERDGFLEILAAPECGGLFAQGWSMSLDAGHTTIASVAGGLSVREVDVATFEREDILPPGHGVCFFCKDWKEDDLQAVDAVFFERDGRLLRLDVVKGSLLKLRTEQADAHVRTMLGRIEGPDETCRAFRRICRPRFGGTDTLSQTPLPIAAAFDQLLQAADGSLLAIGWMLDPTHRVERVLLKSTGNLYAPLEQNWCALPRPDLNNGYGADPRFVDLLGPGNTMHGFIVHVPAPRERVDACDLYLELVLDDDSCLFKPLVPTPFNSAERLPQILGAISPKDPELGRIVEDHIAPFLAAVPPASTGRLHGRKARMIPLGGKTEGRPVTAIMPFRTMAELQPILGVLAGSEEARMIEFILVTKRTTASEHLSRLEDAFRFYGLRGGVVVAPDESTVSSQIDMAASVASGARVLCWMPSALPKCHGWLTALMQQADRLPVPGLLSPALTYEDDSIYFGGARLDDAGTETACALTGYGAEWLPRGAPEMVASGAAEIALIDRDLLLRAGGYSGLLFSDAFAHVDLASRLRRLASGAWCAGAVEFWMLDEPQPDDDAAFPSLMRKVDAALLARRRNEPQSGEISA